MSSRQTGTVVLLVALALAVPAVSAPPALTADWQASAGFLPDQVCPAWTLSDFATPEDPVLGASALTLATDGDELMFYRQTEPALSIPDPFVIEARIRIVSGTASSIRGPAGIGFSTTGTSNDLFIGTDEIFLLTDATTRGNSATVDTDDAPHTYQIVLDGAGTIQVFYDGALTLTGATFASPGATPDINWGDLTDQSGISGTSEWTFVRHNGSACRTPEVCGNCLDDDGDGAVDYADTDCCTPAAITMAKGALKPTGTTTRTKLALALPDLDPTGKDVIVELHRAGGGLDYCARIPAASFKSRKAKVFKFKGTGPGGLSSVALKRKSNGTLGAKVTGKAAQFTAPQAGTIAIVLAFDDGQAAVCPTISKPFQAVGKKGVLKTK